jgi:hypothetical protein
MNESSAAHRAGEYRWSAVRDSPEDADDPRLVGRRWEAIEPAQMTGIIRGTASPDRPRRDGHSPA